MTNHNNEIGTPSIDPENQAHNYPSYYIHLAAHMKRTNPLKSTKLPQLTTSEIDNLNSSILEIEFILKIMPKEIQVCQHRIQLRFNLELARTLSALKENVGATASPTPGRLVSS